MPSPIQALHLLRQSIWYDNIERRLLENGELKRLIASGQIRGITSNPSIFHNAIVHSQNYDIALTAMAWAGYSDSQIYEELVIEDIRTAADLFLPLYYKTNGEDGFVSLEVSPYLARDTQETLAEAKRLWAIVNRPNLMVKIPATREGIPAIRQAISAGINVNITLIFSIARYLEVIDAYLSGLEARLSQNLPLQPVASVASFFISRIDTSIDNLLDKILTKEDSRATRAAALRGRSAIASAKLAYQQFRQAFSGERYLRLQAYGARLQRPLWASTSTKNLSYPDTLYVDNLIAPDTINTMPPQTLKAFGEHGSPRLSLEENLDAARDAFGELASLGISIDQVTQNLEDAGVQAFSDAFTALLAAIEKHRQAAQSELGPLVEETARAVTHLEASAFSQGLYQGDASLWTHRPEDQQEIHKRLGWLDLPEKSRILRAEIESFAGQVRQEGFSHALLLGMGGSSLAPEVTSLIFAKSRNKGILSSEQALDLAILDSTDPHQLRSSVRRSDIRQTLYIVSSKSGGTAEVNALLDYFWRRAQRLLGDKAGSHFVAITDPGTSLESVAREWGFRKVFLGDPEVGGRFSALSVFGLLPAALLGIDLEKWLEWANWMVRQCSPDKRAGRNPGLVLGAVLGAAAEVGRNKLTFLSDPIMAPLGAWIEQLVAESSGKDGVGIVPIHGEPPSLPLDYGHDRIFIYLRTDGKFDRRAKRLRKAGFPVLSLPIRDPYMLGAEFYRWQIATATACSLLKVNAFDQPDVQDSKTRTVDKIRYYRDKSQLEEGFASWEDEDFSVFGALPSGLNPVLLENILAAFFQQASPGDYAIINVYLQRNMHNEAVLRTIRSAVLKKTKLATMVGFGPRYLHSTGQLHKGGANNGLFLLITRRIEVDIAIPRQGITFGVLQAAQSQGDFEALLARNRRVLRVHLKRRDGLKKLVEAFQANWKA